MTGFGPTIGNPNPGPGLRVRFDGSKSIVSADWSCACGAPSEDAMGPDPVEQLVLRAERHRRDECTNEDVRRAAALRDHRRKHPGKRRK
ncbi:hypothetical protein EES45_23125 [Streptomyces sp. ADI97-07]|uniref:hypothetical protein n=1 Tax=Streptomyces sp. ADI97-07 TaxID=1522762 RepID=UPI000F5572E0|nr:hypothetical protein [Streptomyces sp. ADI97-07]RPK76387.1 hypothetical protein EES45_23125 [Streptomyces sp. ADI97-07]